MDPSFGDVIAAQVYKACFKQLYGKNIKAYTEKDDTKLEQCLSSYAKSYDTVALTMIDYLGKLPKTGLTL